MADLSEVDAFNAYLVGKSRDPQSGMTPGERGLYATLVVPRDEQAAMRPKTREALVVSSIAASVAAANAARLDVLGALMADTLPGIVNRTVNEHHGGEVDVEELAGIIRDHVARMCPEYTPNTDPNAPIVVRRADIPNVSAQDTSHV